LLIVFLNVVSFCEKKALVYDYITQVIYYLVVSYFVAQSGILVIVLDSNYVGILLYLLLV
jgi:hypothetical protein